MGIPVEILVDKMYEKAAKKEAKKLIEDGLQASDGDDSPKEKKEKTPKP